MPVSAAGDAVVRGIAEVAWPPIPTADAAAMLAIQAGLESTEWLARETLAQHQLVQLGALLQHARHTSPFYEHRLDALAPGRPLSGEDLAAIPTLSRREVQENYDALRCRAIPPEHGDLVRYQSSGSTGRPLRVIGTRLHGLWWRALMLRDHLWHGRDFDATLLVLKTRIADRVSDNWGRATHGVIQTGPCVSVNSDRDVVEQVRVIAEHKPAYLLSHATNLRALAHHCMTHDIALPGLREVRSYGEMLPGDLRELCRQAWDVPLVDVYSAAELGVIALQCPESGYYHVQSEHVLVEILDDTNQPCPPGTTGRVVATPLHNYAMPLVRYELGDYAVVGGPCSCGRGLPVITRIRGRQRNMLQVPDGTRHWPSIPAKVWGWDSPVRQFQLVQHEPSRIEVRLVAARPLDPGEQAALAERLSERLGWRFDYDFNYLDQIDDGPGFEDFLCLIEGDGI